MKTLTDAQIEELYLFTRKKGIQYYEVQAELVDHLASSIEAEWETNPDLAFDQVLQLVYSRFGIFGFDAIEEQKADALNRQHLKRWRQTFHGFFTLPLAIYSILLFLALREIITLVSFQNFYVPYSGILMAAGLWYIIKMYRRQNQEIQKKLLLLNFMRPFTLVFNLCWYVPVFVLPYFNFLHTWGPALIYTALTLLLLSFMRTCEAIEKQAKTLYPAAFAS